MTGGCTSEIDGGGTQEFWVEALGDVSGGTGICAAHLLQDGSTFASVDYKRLVINLI